MTREEKAAHSGHVVGEIQTPYHDPRDIYDDIPQNEGLGIFVYGCLAAGVAIIGFLFWLCL